MTEAGAAGLEEALGHKARQRWAPVYVRGLLGPGERKSVQPMAARVAPADCDQLHHFISSPAWQTAPLAAVLAREADRLLGGPGAGLIIHDTALPKKGEHSVGVARQYAGVPGKTANCQALVSLTLARGEVPAPVALRLHLPKTWCRDRRRCDKAGVPADCRAFRSKGAIALDELDRLRAAGVRFGCALADAGYGGSAAFRRGLAAPAPLWAVGIPKTQGGYSAAVKLSPPAPQGTGRSRPASPPGGCGWPTARSRRPGTACLGRSCGWSASGAAAASGSTTSPAIPPRRPCRPSRRRSRPAGSASRRTSR